MKEEDSSREPPLMVSALSILICGMLLLLLVATKSTEMLMTPSVSPDMCNILWLGYSRENNSKQESRNQIADVMFLEIRLLIEVEQMKTLSNLSFAQGAHSPLR